MSAWLVLPSRIKPGLTPAGRFGNCAAAHQPMSPLALAQTTYDYYEKEYVIQGRRHGRKFRLGDNLRVKVARINAFRSEIDFELIRP